MVKISWASLNGKVIKRCLKESERAFSMPWGIWIGTRLIKEPPRAEKKLGSARGRGDWDELKREAKRKMSRGERMWRWFGRRHRPKRVRAPKDIKVF